MANWFTARGNCSLRLSARTACKNARKVADRLPGCAFIIGIDLLIGENLASPDASGSPASPTASVNTGIEPTVLRNPNSEPEAARRERHRWRLSVPVPGITGDSRFSHLGSAAWGPENLTRPIQARECGLLVNDGKTSSQT